MAETVTYSVMSVYDALIKTFHQYLRAQYHIWDEALIAERDRLLATPGNTHQEPFLEATPQYASGSGYGSLNIAAHAKAVLELASASAITGIPRTPYVHQERAIETFLSTNNDLIVATGTGSGKTECFLMPILGSLAIEASERKSSWNLPGVRALLIYPMNALVNDQLARLRRLLGNETVAQHLRSSRSGMTTFGMYTGRTPYPGPRTKEKDKKRLGEMLSSLYTSGITLEIKARLVSDGKWPSKDIPRFIANGFKTSPDDCELLTRQEMQTRSPDLLVTNYSMLEYMMLRPIEATIFEQTRDWLAKDSSNSFVVVLDEAHVYRGSGGAEVAYLLRRLQSRLGVSRDRIRYILTSASLGASADAQKEIVQFASKLTGGRDDRYALVTGTLEHRPEGHAASPAEQHVLAGFDFTTLHSDLNLPAAAREINALCNALDFTGAGGSAADKQALQDTAFRLLSDLPVAAMLATQIAASPCPIGSLARDTFRDAATRSHAFEALLALMSFAKEARSGRPFASIRTHLFFRGLPGLFVCSNAVCPNRSASDLLSTLGKLFASPRLHCECGSRVYELMTHRACGAAYIRGFLRDPAGDFMWHEPSTGVWSEGKLIDSQFYVVPDSSAVVEGPLVWLRTATGELLVMRPADFRPGEYLPVIRPTKEVTDRGRTILTIDGDCPSCKRGTGTAPRAMDLMTKGEAPFAHLVRTQVATQPIVARVTPQSPNGGRKALLFSDGRQKAARLARDIPREIEQDVFRQMLILASDQLQKIGEEPTLNSRMYVSFLKAVDTHSLRFFDGTDREKIQSDLNKFKLFFGMDLKEALNDFSSAPPRYTVSLLRQLCGQFYSIHALTLGYVVPSKRALRLLGQRLPNLSIEQITELSVPWLQTLLADCAFDKELANGVRREAFQYWHPRLPRDGFSSKQRSFIETMGIEPTALVDKLAEALCELNNEGTAFILPTQVKLQVAIDSPWFQCATCKSVRPTALWNCCSNCLSMDIKHVLPTSTSYLRARKGFWRDPVASILRGTEQPLNIEVEEHSAQLSYRDVDEPSSTTEEFERRFRDILKTGEVSIDVLSSTTTMEVGIDIGSLIAVGMRNVPPMRQNYQQRAGRAGRRGSSISTVLTYAQNGAHDAFYFSNPNRIISGDPPRPILDTENERIAIRHVYAQLVQDFFRPRASDKTGGDIYSALGSTWEFFTGTGTTSLSAFAKWLTHSSEAKESLDKVKEWLPRSLSPTVHVMAGNFLASLESVRPQEKDRVESSLIEFLFEKGLLPSYAFPRDLCALQIQAERQSSRGTLVKILEQPQQGLNVALSEYAPGKLVVVNKKTYRIGTVAASGTPMEVNRGASLFDRQRIYIHCNECSYTAGFAATETNADGCPQCGSKEGLQSVTVIQPEVVFPRGRREVNEFEDEQTYSRASSAQLPLHDAKQPIEFNPFGVNGAVAFERNRQLVMVNRGGEDSDVDGFDVCIKCGKVLLDSDEPGPHDRDYFVQVPFGRGPGRCNGEFRRVYLGYSFTSDVLLLRAELKSPLRFDLTQRRRRRPIEDALQSLCEAIVLAMGRILDIDAREVSAGYRFAMQGSQTFADIYIYDTLSGGAGYAFQAGQCFGKIFDEVERLLMDCDCDLSCEKCLRHYGNRFHHGVLDRHLASDVAAYVAHGRLPHAFTTSDQVKTLASLTKMLTLAGWKASLGGQSAVRVAKANVTRDLRACPSLVDADFKGSVGGVTQYTFTPYELSRDLPSAYAELT